MGLGVPAVSRWFAVRRNDSGGTQTSAGAIRMPEQSSLSESVVTNHGGRTVLASVAAVASVFAASACCLPLFPFVMAAGLAGGSTFLWTVRPYLLGASILLIAYGFYQARRARKCRRRPNVISSVLLWLSAGFVFLSIFFPQV